jgi:hypothetical protein
MHPRSNVNWLRARSVAMEDPDDGVVTLEGRCERRSLAPTLVRQVYAVDGALHIDPRLGWDHDDTPPRRIETGYLGP